MAESDTEIIVGIKLDDGSSKQLQIDTKDLAEKIGASLRGEISKGVDRSFTGLAIQLEFIGKIAQKAFGLVTETIGHSIDAANEAQQAFVGLTTALRNTGQLTESNLVFIEGFANEFQRLGTVSNEAAIAGAAALTTIGRVSVSQLQPASQAAIDLAAGLGIDVTTAFNLVAKAANGSFETLSRYGIKVRENIPESQKFAEALRQINERFGGLDVAKANTFEGAITQMKNAVNSLFVSIGNIVINSGSIISAVKFIGEQIGKLGGAIGGLTKNDDPFKGLIIGAIDLAAAIATRVLPVFNFLKNLASSVFNVLKIGFQEIIAAAGSLGAGIAGVLNLVHVVSDEQLATSQAFADRQNDILIELAGKTQEAFSSLGDSFSGLGENTPAVDAFFGNMRAQVEASSNSVTAFGANANATMNDVTATMAKNAQAISNAIRSGIANSITNGVLALTKALTSGGNAFAKFGLAILGIIGDMAIQIGSTLIGIGVGMEAVKSSIVGLTGGPAIFAGIALVALGGLLKSLSGGAGATTTAGVTSGGAAAAGGAEAGGLTEQPQLQRNAETKVAINIQGNVLDRRETGLELASVLQEFFDTSDGVLARA